MYLHTITVALLYLAAEIVTNLYLIIGYFEKTVFDQRILWINKSHACRPVLALATSPDDRTTTSGRWRREILGVQGSSALFSRKPRTARDAALTN